VSSQLVNRNVTANRGRTSMRLEPELWDALDEICAREHISLGEVVRRVELRGHQGGRTSAVRVYLLEYFRGAANDAGHRAIGHGEAAGAGRAARGRARPGAQPAGVAVFAVPV
jgi:predicted DNA-binding ribbon-helix-helix protein